MKKVLSVILTMAMLLSMFSCLFTTGAAAETSNSVVIQDFETGWAVKEGTSNQIVRNPDELEGLSKTTYGYIKEDSGSKYLEAAALGSSADKWVHYITSESETGKLESDITYNLSFKYRVHKGTVADASLGADIKIMAILCLVAGPLFSIKVFIAANCLLLLPAVIVFVFNFIQKKTNKKDF